MTNYCDQVLRKTIQLVLSIQMHVNMPVEDERREIYYLRLLILVKEGARGRYLESRDGKNWSYSADIAKQFEKKFDEYTSARSVAMNMRFLQNKGLVVSTKSRDLRRTLWAIVHDANFDARFTPQVKEIRCTIENEK